MSFYSDWYEPYYPEETFPQWDEDDLKFGINSDPKHHVWTMKDHSKIKFSDMTTTHIIHCMKFFDPWNPWYKEFQKELDKRDPSLAHVKRYKRFLK